jgi:hypothetical protein
VVAGAIIAAGTVEVDGTPELPPLPPPEELLLVLPEPATATAGRERYSRQQGNCTKF